MAITTIPIQERGIDPYSSYNSNIVNSAVTKPITGNQNCLFSTHAIEVTSDSTSPLTHIIIGTGICYKDNVGIEITEEFQVDMEDSDFYLTSSAMYPNAGYYYICLQYTYVKSKPAPQARIRILNPNERSLYSRDSEYLFLKCVKVVLSGGLYVIDSLYNYDPENPDNKRLYTPLFAGVEDVLPTFVQEDHEAKIIYVRSKDALYWGLSGRWEEFSSIRDRITTTGCTVGQLGYLTTAGIIQPAIATSNITLANCGVLQIGIKEDGSGQVRLFGLVEGVPVESGRTLEIGESCYLSNTVVGAVTDLMPANYTQFVGTAISDSTAGIDIVDIWFQPGSQDSGGSDQGSTFYDIYQDLLQASIFQRLTMDTFVNLDYVDQINTTATLDTINKEIDGTFGDIFQSSDLIDNDSIYGYDGTCLVSCQLTRREDSSVQSWYVNNNGLSEEWEPVTLNEVHWFSTANIPIDSTASFEIGEIIVGQTSGTTAIVNSNYNLYLLIRSLTGPQVFSNGETIIGNNSGASAIIDGIQTSRIDDNKDLRVKCIFTGTGTINDYGILYEMNTDLIVSNNIANNEYNIDTLYSDLYSTPSLDNDGAPNLTIPIETCKNNIQTFIGSDGDSDITPIYNSNTIINDGDNLETAISDLDDWTGFVRNSRIVSSGDTTPSVLDSNNKQCGILHINNSGSTTITDFSDSTSGIIIVLLFNDINTTIQHNSNIYLAYSLNFIPSSGDSLTLIYDSNNLIWKEISRQELSPKFPIVSKTDNYAITISDFGKCFRMVNALDKTFTLPSVGSNENGARITFIKNGAGRVTIDTADSDLIDDSSAGGTIYCDIAGELASTITLEYIHSNITWGIISGKGTWVTT